MQNNYSAATNEYTLFSDQLAELEKQRSTLAAEVDAAILAVTNGITKRNDLLVSFEKTVQVETVASEQVASEQEISLAPFIQAMKEAGDAQRSFTNGEAELKKLVEAAQEKQAVLDRFDEDLSRAKSKFSELSQETHLERQIIEAQSRQDKVKLTLAAYPLAESYFANFSLPAVQKTLTDADGRFSINYTRDSSLTIFAKAERVIGTKTEKYFWLVDAPTNSESAQIFLSNQNLVHIDPDGYFKIKPVDSMRELESSSNQN
jgi:hypothetical protein